MVRSSGDAFAEGTAVRENWVQWPIFWSAVWAGTLAALATALIIGLIGIAIGAHQLTGPESRIYELKKIGLVALFFSVFGSFLAFVVGGWVAGKVAGILRSEPAMLHGALSWLVAVPLLVVMTGLGAGSFFGGWYGGLGGTPSWAMRESTFAAAAATVSPTPTAEERARYDEAMRNSQQTEAAKEREARAARNSALVAVTALLLGLVGSVIGGWMASGEPMTFTFHKTRAALASSSSPHRPTETSPAGQQVYGRR